MQFNYKTKPYNHQRLEFEQHWDDPIRALFWEMGTGKSKPMVDTSTKLYLDGAIDAVFTLAPNGVHQNWTLDEIPTHFPDEVPHSVFTWHSMRRKTKRFQNEYTDFLKEPGLRFLAMSYDAIMTEDGRKAAKEFLNDHRCFYVADETTLIKTPGSKRTKRVVASGPYAPFRRILTGQPVADDPFHVFSQVKFLDKDFWKRELGIRYFSEFKTYFGIWGSGYNQQQAREFKYLLRHIHLDELRGLLDGLGSRILKEDVLDLPPKIYNKVYFDLPPAQRKVYDQIKKEFMAEFEDGEIATADLAIARMTRLQQICSGYLPADDEEALRPLFDKVNPRLKILREVLETVPRQAIIWGKYNVDIDEIAQLLDKLGETYAIYDGRTSPEDRQKAKRDFQAGRVRFFLGKPSACGRGLTLTAADTVIYFNNSFILDERLQSEDRAHRIGQERPVNYIDIVARKTIDEYIIDNLRRKREISAQVMGDSLGDWI
jgi:hypothetical protein